MCFTRFREKRNGPYDLFIDAANVAFFGQNYAGGGFNWGQVKRMVEKVDKAHPDKKLLVVRIFHVSVRYALCALRGIMAFVHGVANWRYSCPASRLGT
jgi:hypothetical protein